jgi:PAS domain S-box-containing protein
VAKSSSREQLEDRIKELKQYIQDSEGTTDKLRKSRLYYQTLLDNAPVGIWHASQDGSGGYINSKLAEISGLTPEAAKGTGWTSTLHPEDQERVFAEWTSFVEGKKAYNSTYRFKHPDGNVRWVVGQATPVLDETGSKIGHIGILTDITERVQAERTKKLLERQIQQVQKLEAIGTLAGGIAHDFNNLLMGIQGRTSLMLTDTASSHPYFEHLKGIEDYVKSAADLTKQLLGFAMGGKYDVKTTDLNNLITNQNQMFGRTRKDITIREKYEKDLWTVEVDQGQIQQVLLNLYINAWQAMPGGGDLYIQTQNVNLDEHYTKPFKASPGKYVKVSVTDTGVGMDEVTRQKIFDPFFTTKEMGRGTGLGMASVYGIVKNHEGFITVYSKKGEGATFNIYLPATEKETVKEKELAKDELKGSEIVLLVDDEDMIIDVGQPMLEKMGYNVLVAKDGREALEIYQKNEQDIDMVILDLIMPDIGGGDTYDRLKEINPEIKVLLSSGYSIDGQASEILERGCSGFIQKPFNMKKLSQKIREILDKD